MLAIEFNLIFSLDTFAIMVSSYKKLISSPILILSNLKELLERLVLLSANSSS